MAQYLCPETAPVYLITEEAKGVCVCEREREGERYKYIYVEREESVYKQY